MDDPLTEMDAKTKAVWLERLRRTTPEERFLMALDLTDTTRLLAWQGLCERYPEESEGQRRRRFVALLYGEELAREMTEAGCL